MGACRKKPAQPASGTFSWMTPSETLLRLCLGGFGKIFAKQRLLLAFVRFHGPIFETEKPFENVCTTRGLPCSSNFSRSLTPRMRGSKTHRKGGETQVTSLCTVSATPYPITPCDFVRRCPCTTIHAKTLRKHLFSTSELQRGCCAGSKKLVRHFENASDWNVFATSRSKFEKNGL